MAYAQGGLITATDYNTFVGSSPSSTSNTINTVWAVGNGNAGYGQTAVSQVVQSNTITATQWASLINTLNSILTHQSGSGSGISAVTAGTKVNYLSTLSTNVNNAYSNRLAAASTSSVTTGSTNTSSAFSSGNTNSTLTRAFGMRATFASADQARYFFNAGGRLKYNVSGAQSGDSSARTNAAVALCGYLGGVTGFISSTNGGRTGSGGTLNANDTNKGYYNATSSNVTIVSVTSTTSSYTSDTATIQYRTNGLQGSNSDNGSYVEFWTNLSSTPGSGSGFNDSLGMTVSQSIDITYPETTNLTSSWGTITLTAI